jgi:hypothetical protein
MLENKNEQDRGQGKDMVKFAESLQPRWYGHAERMQNLRMPKQIAKTTMEGTRK